MKKILLIFSIWIISINNSEGAIFDDSYEVVIKDDIGSCNKEDLIMPIFKGGGDVNDFRKWISRRLRFPDVSFANNQTEIRVSFVINNRGKVTDIKVLQSTNNFFSDEVVRALQSCPKWTPGNVCGKDVSVMFTLPVSFIAPK